jgi:UDP-2,4-diacetamido-2,4,6-trideoxy-beta-L-gulopyranose hydrolase
MVGIQKITNFEENIIHEDENLLNSLQKIENCSHKILFVVNDDKLVGLISNGDLRRGLINGASLSETIKNIINYDFDYLDKNYTKDSVKKLLSKNLISYIPVVNKNMLLESILYVPSEVNEELRNSVLLMAGGKGSRLGEITKNKPKPLVDINGVTLLEYQLKKLDKFGFKKIYISLYHMANQIIDKVSEFNLENLEIVFITEKEPLGTAGSLFHLKDETLPVLTLNCDVVTDANFREMYTALQKRKSDILVGVRPFNTFIPYGVIKVENKKVVGFDEKPMYLDWVSAGINIISNEIISNIVREEYLDMSELIKRSIKKYSVDPYYVTERWLDVGSQEELSKLDIL